VAFTAFSVSAADSDITLRIGVYENPPKIELDDQGQISGIFGDLIIHIAAQEGWQIEPVPCEWTTCLEMTRNGEIDLMPDVAFSDIRSEQFNFHTEPALLSWSQVYAAPRSRISSLLALDGQRVAVLEGSIQYVYLQELANQFDLTIEWVFADDFAHVFEEVLQGNADAAVSNQFLGDRMAADYGLEAAPVLFQPTRLYFAAADDSLYGVLETIDAYLVEWKANPDSYYFQTLDRWSATSVAETRIPDWIIATVVLLLLVLLATLITLRKLRVRVFARTKELQQVEVKLETIINSVEAYVYIKDKELRYRYVNERCAQLFKRTPEELIGMSDAELFDEKTCEHLRKTDLRVIEGGERVEVEEQDRVAGGKAITVLSVKVPLFDANGDVYALCGVSTDVSEYKKVQEELHQYAYYDTLTGLANRRKLLDLLKDSVEQSRNKNHQGGLIVLGLDNFKAVNDTLGHATGDLLLQEVGSLLISEMLPGEACSRLGADEFAVVLPFIDGEAESARALLCARASELVRRLERQYQLDTINYSGTSSVGAILFSDVETHGVSAVLKGADLALQAAKASGKNTYSLFNQEMQREIDRVTSLESKLRSAMGDNALELYIQPQWDASEQVLGMEALLRWEDPELGFVSPGEFIPVAETSGLIIPLGEWAVQRACEILADWDANEDFSDLTLSVNISARQFRHPNFVSMVEQALLQSGAAGEKLKIEITESVLIDDVHRVRSRMEALRELGITLSLDDFGTSYASLSYLKSLPLHELKIDQGFVRDLLTDSSDEAIINAIIGLGESLNLSVIAEGVETVEHKQRLLDMGCFRFQGFYFGRPEPVSEWENKLKGRVIRTDG